MARQKRDTKALLGIIGRNKLRSSLFWWMVEEHDKILAAANGEKMEWRSFCAEASKRGKTDTRGRQPTEGNARETWRQARKYVAETRAVNAAKPPPAVHPSRIAKDWRPPNAPPPPGQALAPSMQANVPSANNFIPVRKNEPQEIEPYDPSKQMARLRRIMAERSGRKWRE
jgi:hypothetical protein